MAVFTNYYYETVLLCSFIPGGDMCDVGGGGLGSCHVTPPLPTPHPLGLYLPPHPPTTLDYQQICKISIEIPTKCIFTFGLLTEVEEGLMRGIAIISRRASLSFS